MSGPDGSLPGDEGAADPAAEVEAALAGLDETELAAILAELRRLEAL